MEQRFSTKTFFAFFLTFLGVLLFSAKAVLVKLAYHYDIDALSLLVLRLMFSLPFYIGVIIVTARPSKLSKFSGFDYLKIMVLGILGYYLASYLDFAGLKYVSASLERLIIFIYPTLVVIITAIILRKRPPMEQRIAIMVTYFGVFLAFYKDTNVNGPHTLLGTLLVFGSALSYAFYLVGTGDLLPRFGTKLFTSFAMIVSTSATLIHFFIANSNSLLHYPKEVYLLALIMAIFCTVIPSFLISEAIKRLGASNVAIMGSIGPICTISLASILLGEHLNIFQMLGTLIVVSGVLLIANREGKKKEKEESKEEFLKVL